MNIQSLKIANNIIGIPSKLSKSMRKGNTENFGSKKLTENNMENLAPPFFVAKNRGGNEPTSPISASSLPKDKSFGVRGAEQTEWLSNLDVFGIFFGGDGKSGAWNPKQPSFLNGWKWWVPTNFLCNDLVHPIDGQPFINRCFRFQVGVFFFKPNLGDLEVPCFFFVGASIFLIFRKISWLKFGGWLVWNPRDVANIKKKTKRFRSFLKQHLSNENNPGWLGYIGDYTIQLYRDYNKPL